MSYSRPARPIISVNWCVVAIVRPEWATCQVIPVSTIRWRLIARSRCSRCASGPKRSACRPVDSRPQWAARRPSSSSSEHGSLIAPRPRSGSSRRVRTLVRAGAGRPLEWRTPPPTRSGRGCGSQREVHGPMYARSRAVWQVVAPSSRPWTARRSDDYSLPGQRTGGSARIGPVTKPVTPTDALVLSPVDFPEKPEDEAESFDGFARVAVGLAERQLAGGWQDDGSLLMAHRGAPEPIFRATPLLRDGFTGPGWLPDSWEGHITLSIIGGYFAAEWLLYPREPDWGVHIPFDEVTPVEDGLRTRGTVPVKIPLIDPLRDGARPVSYT